jgi:hypothetical protein
MAAPSGSKPDNIDQRRQMPRLEAYGSSQQRHGRRAQYHRLGRLVISLAVVAASLMLGTSWAQSATGSTPDPDGGVTVGPVKPVTLTGHWEYFSLRINYTGKLDVKRLWDRYNQCVEENGSQYENLAVTTGQIITIGVTTVSSGSCSYQTTSMHWRLTRMNADGTKSKDSADIQLMGSTVAGYFHNCEGTTAKMTCDSRTPAIGLES